MPTSLRLAAALLAAFLAPCALPGQSPASGESGQAEPPWTGATEQDGFGLWIGNVVPPLQELIQSRMVADLLVSPELAEFVPELAGTSPVSLARQLEAVQAYIPVDVRLGVGEEWMDDFVRSLRIVTAGLHIHAGMGEEAARQRIEALLGELAPIPLSARATFRDARTAEQLFEGLAGVLAEAPDGVEVKEDGDLLRVHINVGTALAGSPMARLAQAYAEDDDQTERWVQALAKLDLAFEFSLGDAAISVTTPGVSSGAMVLPRKLWADGPSWARAPLVHTAWRVDPEPVLELEAEFYELFELDDFDSLPIEIFDFVSKTVDELAMLTARGEAIVHVGDGGISSRIVEILDEIDRIDWEVEDTTVLRLTGGGFAAGTAVPAMSLDFMLSTLLGELDAQLERRDVPGSVVEWFRWEAMTAMEDYIHGDESSLFETGAALVLDRGGALGELTCGKDPWDAGTAAIPAVAIVGRPEDERAGKAFVHEFGRCLGSMLGAEEPAAIGPGPTLRVGDRDVESWELPIAGSALLPTAPEGCRPVHAAIHDGWLVVSTGTELSERIFAALGGPDPASAEHGELATASWFAGIGPLADNLTHLGTAMDADAFGAFADAVGWSDRTRQNLATLRRAMATVALVCRPLEGRHEAWLDGDELTQHWWIRPADAGK